MDDLEARLGSILEFPWEVLEYRRWLDAAPQTPEQEGDYLFAEPTARFEPRPGDAVLCAPDLRVEDVRAGVRLRSAQAGAEVRIPGLTRPAVERLLAAVDGRRTLLELEALPGQQQPHLRALLDHAFGVVLFAPAAVEALERRLSGMELVRFPGSPYEIERSYWENSCAVRAHLEQRLEGAVMRGSEELRQLLRELNVLMLMGDDLRTFYRPASPIGRRSVTPGALLTAPTRLLETSTGLLFLEGPRVNASFVVGDVFGAALAGALGDPDAATGERVHVDEGVEWGRVVHARASNEPAQKAWFCPPRPLQAAHWAGLAQCLARGFGAARAGERADCVDALARVHQRMVRMHPFRCANQSVAMNIVNFVLTRSHGAGMPHLWLDHLALRLSPEAYARAFAAAVDAYVITGVGPLARYSELRDRKRRAFNLLRELAPQPDVPAALACVRGSADAALVLFAPGSAQG